MNEIDYLTDVISKNSFAIEIINAGGNSIYDTARNKTVKDILSNAPINFKQQRLTEMFDFLIESECILVANEKPFKNSGHDISQELTKKFLS